MADNSFYMMSYAPTPLDETYTVATFSPDLIAANQSQTSAAYITATVSTEPFLISLFPNPITAGQTLVITGLNLNRVGAVVVDGVGRDFNYVNPTTITVQLPLMTTGPKQVYVNYI